MRPFSCRLALLAKFLCFTLMIGTGKSFGGPPIEFLEASHPSSSSAFRETVKQASQLDLELALERALANESHTHDNNLINVELAALAWAKMEHIYLRHISSKVISARNPINQLLHVANVSEECLSSINLLLDGLSRLDQPHWTMWNSWGSLPPIGLFQGSYSDLGSYRGCLEMSKSDQLGEPQYCMLDYQPLVPSRPRFHSIFQRILKVDPEKQLQSCQLNGNIAGCSFTTSTDTKYRIKSETFAELANNAHHFYYINLRLGSCWPSKCSQSDVHNISRLAASRIGLQASKTQCTTREMRSKAYWNKYQIVSISILISLASFTFSITLIDLFMNLCEMLSYHQFAHWIRLKFGRLIDICSISRNLARLFYTQKSLRFLGIRPNDTSRAIGGSLSERIRIESKLNCLDGLRVISMVWIIYGHSLLNLNYNSFTHTSHMLEKSLANPFILPTLNTNFSVDTFFLISGLLNSYIVFCLKYKLKIRFNGFLFILARYLRLTPQLFIAILLFFLLPLFGDGPLYEASTQVYTERCYKNFWLNLIYLQAYVNRRELCMVPSWWLSIEMSLYLISLLVIYIILKWGPKWGLIVNGLVIGLMSFISVLVHYSNKFAIQYLPSVPQMYEVELEQTQTFFHKPYPHAASYFIGLALGYLLASRKIKRLTCLQQTVCWFLFVSGLIITLFGDYSWNKGESYTQLEATFYYNACQVLWPTSIASLIILCVQGHANYINKILSSNVFVPLSRITYMTYLTHIVVVYYTAGSLQKTYEPNSVALTIICVSNITISFALATILSVVYESPIMRWLKSVEIRKFNSNRSTRLGANGLVVEQLR